VVHYHGFIIDITCIHGLSLGKNHASNSLHKNSSGILPQQVISARDGHTLPSNTSYWGGSSAAGLQTQRNLQFHVFCQFQLWISDKQLSCWHKCSPSLSRIDVCVSLCKGFQYIFKKKLSAFKQIWVFLLLWLHTKLRLTFSSLSWNQRRFHFQSSFQWPNERNCLFHNVVTHKSVFPVFEAMSCISAFAALGRIARFLIP